MPHSFQNCPGLKRLALCHCSSLTQCSCKLKLENAKTQWDLVFTRVTMFSGRTNRGAYGKAFEHNTLNHCAARAVTVKLEWTKAKCWELRICLETKEDGGSQMSFGRDGQGNSEAAQNGPQAAPKPHKAPGHSLQAHIIERDRQGSGRPDKCQAWCLT